LNTDILDIPSTNKLHEIFDMSLSFRRRDRLGTSENSVGEMRGAWELRVWLPVLREAMGRMTVGGLLQLLKFEVLIVAVHTSPPPPPP
jgi:hypothetical protein